MYSQIKAAFLGVVVAALTTILIPALLWDLPYKAPTASEITTALNVQANDVDVQQTTQSRTYATPPGSIDPAWSRYVVGLEDVSLKSTTIVLKEPLSRSELEKQLPPGGWSLSPQLDQRIYTKHGLRVTVDGSVRDKSLHASKVSPAWLAPTSTLLGVVLGLCAFLMTRTRLTNGQPTATLTVGACLVAPTLLWQLGTATYETFAVEEALRGLHYYAYPFEAFVVSAAWKIGALILVAAALRARHTSTTKDLVST